MEHMSKLDCHKVNKYLIFDIKVILAIVNFNMCFIFAWDGLEREAHNSPKFGEALRRSELNFPHSLENKYYLVDAKYEHMKGLMAPYKGDNVKYHLCDFRRGTTR